MRVTLALIAGAALGGLILIAALSGAPAAPPAKAAPFALIDQDGRTVRLADFQDKIVVLEWVNPECPFVQRHYKAGTMVSLAETYQPRGVVWLSINSTASASVPYNKRWADQQKLPYPVLDDHAGAVARAYAARTTPHMFVLDTQGRIVYQGAIDDDPKGQSKQPLNYVDQALTELLAGKPVSTVRSTPYGCTVKYRQ